MIFLNHNYKQKKEEIEVSNGNMQANGYYQPTVINNPQAQNPYFNQFAQINTAAPYPSNSFGMRNDKNFQQNQFLKCRPVSSKEEAMACQIDLDGSLWVFADIGN